MDRRARSAEVRGSIGRSVDPRDLAHLLDEVESVARLGWYSLDIASGRWTSSSGLDAILGIDDRFERSVGGWASLIHPDERAGLLAYLADEVIGRGQLFDREYRIVRPDDRAERWVHGRGTLELDRSGRPVRMLGTIADVTERRTAHEALARSERRARAILEGAIEGIVIAELATLRVRWANPAACAMFGYTADEFLGLSVPDLHPAADLPTVLEGFEAVASGRIGLARSTPCRRKDGSRLLADIRASRAIIDGLPCNVGFFADVTALRELELHEHQLAQAVEQATDAIVITDPTPAIQYVNSAYERLSGYRRDQVVGRNPNLVASGLQPPALYAALWATLDAGEPWAGQLVNRRRDGSLYEVSARLSPLRAPDGGLAGYVGIERDVTRERGLETSLAAELSDRALAAASLARLQPQASLEETAALVCGELRALSGVDAATIIAFDASRAARVLAVDAPAGFPISAGLRLPAARAKYLATRAGRGPWTERWRPRSIDGSYAAALTAVGLRAAAYAPIRNGEGLLGVLIIAALDDASAEHVLGHLPIAVEFGATAGALIAHQLETRRHEERRRARIAAIVSTRAFKLVFQPIVELEYGAIVGYEALTRFSGGARPDVVFADAWELGLGAELERATLAAAVAAARALPAGRWLDLNVSPRFLTGSPDLADVLAGADRPIVLELTEHEVVGDYVALRAAVEALGPRIRTAVDDAGAGVANFTHLVELRPDFVKLDIGLVRDIEADLGRQAMVIALRHFADATGCRLVAEGVETQAQADAVLGLGVDFGQGHWYGRPASIEGRAARSRVPVSSHARERSPRRRVRPSRAQTRCP